MFITFEGVEGAGKSTQIQALALRIKKHFPNVPLVITREPGDGPLGPLIRSIVLEAPDTCEIDARTELLLMLADRCQHVNRVIVPCLLQHGIVLCDRFMDSTVAYQGYGRELPLDTVILTDRFARADLLPDKTFLIDIDPSIGLGRQSNRNRMEAESIDFHTRVRSGFLAIAEAAQERIVVLDGTHSVIELNNEIWNRFKLEYIA